MFTGITQQVITINDIQSDNDLLIVDLAYPNHRYVKGDSILLNGICSTVIKLTDNSLTVEYMPQTINSTTVKEWNKQQLINAESALTLQDFISGSIVTGHVDTIAQVSSVLEQDNNYELTFTLNKKFNKYIIDKGCITIDGVNLTIAKSTNESVTVCLVPYTLEHTNLEKLKTNDLVNVEFDYLSKSMAKLVKQRT